MSDVVAQCYNDKEAVVNDRPYIFSDITHKDRLAIFGYFSSIQYQLSQGSYSFVSSDEWAKIEALMFSKMTFDNESLLKRRDRGHFEEFGEDYLKLIVIAMQVFCYPFMKGVK